MASSYSRFDRLEQSFDNLTSFWGYLWTRRADNCDELPSKFLEPRGSDGVNVGSSLVEFVQENGKSQSECCVLFVPDACVNPKTSEYRAFVKWKQMVSEAVNICRELRIEGFTDPHDDFVLWVANINRNPPARYAQDLMQKLDLETNSKEFRYDPKVGLMTKFPSLPDASAAFCRFLSTREAAGHEPHDIQDGDGVFKDSRLVIWGGRKFEFLTGAQFRVVELLLDRYKAGRADVTTSDICRIAKIQACGGFKQNVFKLNRKDWPRVHPVECIVVQSSKDTYRLIDPKKVPACS